MSWGGGSVSRVAPLTPAQERDLVIAAEAGDPGARLRLVEEFIPAITAVARRFPDGLGVEHQELVQEGVTGLLFAARRYDARLGTPFWAYATFWVRKAMQELFAELSRPVALSDRAVRDLARIRAARVEHLRARGAEPTGADLSRATGMSPEQLERLLATERTPRGLEERTGAEDGPMPVVATIADPAAEQAYDRVLDRIEVGEVRDLVDGLDERARRVIRAHYGLGEPAQTLGQIGGALGLSAERARQIEAAALRALRDALDCPPRAAPEPV
jgi:RNA polymerase primary sigma factor